MTTHPKAVPSRLLNADNTYRFLAVFESRSQYLSTNLMLKSPSRQVCKKRNYPHLVSHGTGVESAGTSAFGTRACSAQAGNALHFLNIWPEYFTRSLRSVIRSLFLLNISGLLAKYKVLLTSAERALAPISARPSRSRVKHSG
jgi:hypothetical protein